MRPRLGSGVLWTPLGGTGFYYSPTRLVFSNTIILYAVCAAAVI